jgi:hypothetical protein
MIHKIGSYLNTHGMIYSFSFAIFILIMFAVEHLEYKAFAKAEPSPWMEGTFQNSKMYLVKTDLNTIY